MATYTKARIQIATKTIKSFDIAATTDFVTACRQARQIVEKLALKTCFHVRVVELRTLSARLGE